MYAKDKAVCKDCEKRRKAFYCVDEGDRDFRSRSGGKDVTADLKEGEGESCGYYVAARIPNAVLQSCDRVAKWWVNVREVGEEDAPEGDEGELDESEGDWLWEGIEDRFRRCVCQSRT